MAKSKRRPIFMEPAEDAANPVSDRLIMYRWFVLLSDGIRRDCSTTHDNFGHGWAPATSPPGLRGTLLTERPHVSSRVNQWGLAVSGGSTIIEASFFGGASSWENRENLPRYEVSAKNKQSWKFPGKKLYFHSTLRTGRSLVVRAQSNPHCFTLEERRACRAQRVPLMPFASATGVLLHPKLLCVVLQPHWIPQPIMCTLSVGQIQQIWQRYFLCCFRHEYRWLFLVGSILWILWFTGDGNGAIAFSGGLPTNESKKREMICIMKVQNSEYE